ncbi:MAG: Eco29kI family restriction endonuclease [Armatimonadetes bacterium]|nr:Eco29kI family restriction endonuclease [Armatimonadota bacterium]
MPATPYNPLDKDSIGDNIVRELMAQECVPLPAPKSRRVSVRDTAFAGAGIYAIYYFGHFPAYARIASENAGGCKAPIYIGKADPKGGRKGALELDASAGFSLYNRLKDHATSIEQAANLRLADFRCRYLVVDDIWISLGERKAIQRYLPLWNTLIDGFGNHDPGVRRKDQYRSDWDVMHPGRAWAEKLGQSPKTAEQILQTIAAPPPPEQLEKLAADVLDEEQ